MSRRFTPVALLAPCAVAAMALVATLGFRGIFPDWTFLASAMIGATGAVLFSVLGRALGLLLPESVAVSLVGFVLFGSVATTGLPTPSGWSSFFDGLVNGWAELLSSIPPASLTEEYRVIPYTVAWASAMVGSEILRSKRTTAFAVLGPILGLSLSTLITIEDRGVAVTQGAVLAAGALLLGSLDQRRRAEPGSRRTTSAAPVGKPTGDSTEDDEPSPFWFSRPWQVAMSVVMAAGVAAVAVWLGPSVPNADDNTRFDLREFQTPPFDPLEQPTPLSQVKVGLQDANADRVLFTVTSDEPIDRITLAILDHYTSEFWAVADETGDAPAEFRPVDRAFPEPTDGTLQGWSEVSATIDIVDLDRLAGGEFDPPWLPVPGWPITVDADSPLDLRFNARSGTIALAPDGPSSGLTYEVTALVPPPLERLTLQSATVTQREPFDLAVPQLRSFAGDVLEGADVGWEQVEAIRTRLVDSGAYDSRAASPAGRPGHSLGRLAEFVDDPEQLVAFEEQYAATAALLARSQGLPARVAVGFMVDDDELAERRTGTTTRVLASDITAWIEVRFDGIGWLPFDVTPPRERQPEDSPVGRTEREVAVPNPPPEPPPPALPPDLDLETELDEDIDPVDDPTDDQASGIRWLPILIGVGIAIPILALLGAMLAIVILKRRRAERRRHAPTASLQVAGAWYELMDRLAERGARPPRAATNREVAVGLRSTEVFAEADGDVLEALADDVDRAAFHPTPADDLVATRAWERADELGAAIGAGESSVARWRSRFDPAPLRTKDPIGHIDGVLVSGARDDDDAEPGPL